MADQKQWFKLWYAALHDDDLLSLSMEDRWRWAALGAHIKVHGTKGRLEIHPENQSLAFILECPKQDVISVIKRLPNVLVEECENSHGKLSVTYLNWIRYQEDSTQAARQRASRSKRRGEETEKDKKKEKRNIPPSGDGVDLANLLTRRIKENNPAAKVTAFQVHEWAKSADLMVRKDGHTPKEIMEVIEWSQQDEFWSTVILSMGKFREKWNTLSGKMRNDGRFCSRLESPKKVEAQPEPKCPDCGHQGGIHVEPRGIPKGFVSTRPKVCAVALSAAREGGKGCMCGLKKETPVEVGRGMDES